MTNGNDDDDDDDNVDDIDDDDDDMMMSATFTNAISATLHFQSRDRKGDVES